jgi:hypothetical protein
MCAILALVGCTTVNPSDDIHGIYQLHVKGATVSLNVKPDHTYTEVARSGNRVLEVSGKWRYAVICIDFDQLVIPTGLVPRDDSSKLSDPAWPFEPAEHWCMPGEKRLGQVVLVVNPNRDSKFEMVRR